MNAFITGSRAYGTPKKESDIDLCVLVDQQTKDRLTKLSKNKSEPVRFGNLNLVLVTTEEEFAAWKCCTATMVRNKVENKSPSSKETATRLIKERLRELGFYTKKPSGRKK